jgi:hypothetical protein
MRDVLCRKFVHVRSREVRLKNPVVNTRALDISSEIKTTGSGMSGGPGSVFQPV